MIYVKRNNVSQTPVFERRQYYKRRTEESFTPLNIYFWIHGIGFTKRFRCTWNNVFVIFISLIFASCFDINKLYYEYILHRNTPIHSLSMAFNSFVKSLEFLQRFLLYAKRRKLNSVIQRISTMYEFMVNKNSFKFKTKLSFILLFHDICIIIIQLKFSSMVKAPDLFGYLGDNYYYGDIPAPHSTRMFYLAHFLLKWADCTSCISFYFCAVCFALKKIFQGLKKKLCSEEIKKTDNLFYIYKETTDLISEVNIALHDILVVTLTSFFINIFQVTTSMLLTSGHLKSIQILLLIPLLIKTVLFILVCFSSSSVSYAASEVKDTVLSLHFNASHFYNIRFILKVNEKFIGFSLLDDIFLDKKFVLITFGTVFSYGIMVATWATAKN